MGVRFRLPLVDWTTDQVKDYVGRESLNPLYEDFDRVGCFPCLAAGDEYKEKAFAYDDFGREQKRKVIMIGQQIGKSIWTSKGGKKRNECAICTFG